MSAIIANLLVSLIVFATLAFIALLITFINFLIKGLLYKHVVIYDQEIIMKHQSIMITLIATWFIKSYFGYISFFLTLVIYVASIVIVKLANIGTMKRVQEYVD